VSARLTAPEKVARLLAVIPYVAGRGPVPIDEIAARFSYPKKELVADLTGVVGYVGVAPFTPDTMIEVTVDDEHVWIVYGKWFERPMRLEPGEALSLFAAGRTLLTASGDDADGPLLRALTKLGAALGAGGDAPVDIVLGSAQEHVLAELRQAIATERCVELDYYSYGRDRRSQRTVEPHRVFADDGQWYLAAWCRLAAGDRVFRVDRIHSVQQLDEAFVPPASATAVVDPSAAEARVTLDLAPEARWVVDQYPHDAAEALPDGWTRVVLPVTAPAWLERLLVRLGPLARPVQLPDGAGDAPAAVAARRILARYSRSTA
jgi:proteasome accessory factor C